MDVMADCASNRFQSDGTVVSSFPRSVLSWLPFIWSAVLFPGKAPERDSGRASALLLLMVLPGVLLYPCLSFHLFEPDEGRYAEIPREMLARGDWVVPYLQGEPYLDKPPLLYWLVMGSYRLFGVYDWSARLIPALAVHACILLTYLLGRRSLGERAAFWGSLALSLAPGFISMGRLLVLDGLLALWVTLSQLAGFEALRGQRLRWGWWLLASAACGLGLLTKGPVALVLLLPPLLMQYWLNGQLCWPSRGAWLVFASLALMLSLPWYTAVWLALPQFGGYFFWKHNLLRFLTPFDHQQPVWFYGPIVAAGLFPASLLAVSFFRFLASGDGPVAEKRCPALGYLLLAGGWCVGFFSLSGCKLPTYVLPAFPPLALALGAFIAATPWRQRRQTRFVAGLAVLLLAATHYVLLPWYARFHSPMSHPDEVARYCGDPRVSVVCFPRNVDSVSFYLGRDDLRIFRSKEIGSLLEYLFERPRTVVLFAHRHSPDSLRHALPPGLRLTGLTPMSKSWASAFRTEFCYMGIVERDPPP
jgi:4-amino-4-deoxy-L-arabinose transferase-like glycosyltransferase